MIQKSFFYLLICFFLSPISLLSQDDLIQSAEPPVIPVGQDAYLQWHKLPYHRIGVRAYMRSTYDRDGNNRGADAGHFLYQESDSFNVTLDVKGNGILYFKRTNHFHGSPWHYEIDGKDHIVKETATDDPVDAKNKYTSTTFIPQDLFPYPLTWTWSTTKGADLMWRPLPFENSLRIAYSRTFYGTGYYIYHLFAPETKHLSRAVETWDEQPPDPAVLELINRAGTDIVGVHEDMKTHSGDLTLKPYQWTAVAELEDAPSTIRMIKFSVPRKQGYDFGKCRIRITWDDRWHASVDAPIDLFFGAGHLYNNNDREYLVKGLPMVIRYDENFIYLTCYYPMPFFRNAVIEIQERNGKKMEGIHYEIRNEPYNDPINHVGYFHATYSDHPSPELGQDITFLDTDNTEGGGPWSGNFVGMSWIFSREGHLHVLEGDPRFFFDNSKTPQAWGTGSEEWGGGGDYWGGENMTIPFAGHPVGTSSKNAENEKDLVNSAYRFLIADHFPFGNRAIINLEHGGVNDVIEHYSGVVYWYGIDAASLVLTDELNVCNRKDALAHDYQSPTAKEPYTLVSRYELGPDTDSTTWHSCDDCHGGRQHFPAVEDAVRTMTGNSQFIMKIEPENLGVLLRRKFDYGYPNQHAKVYVRKFQTENWKYAGEWYTAGSNTCVYSRPEGGNFSKAELAPTEHHIITSNRRWREEEFLIGRELTQGISKLEIKIEHVPNNTALFPGNPFPEKSVWSEARYWAYSYVMPMLKENISKGAYNPASVIEHLRRDDFITDWMVIGPFDNTENKEFNTIYAPENTIDLYSKVQGESKELVWQKAEVDFHGLLNFDKIIGKMNYKIAYAYTRVWAPEEMSAVILFGSDDGAKMWLNKEEIYAVDMQRGVIDDDEKVTVQLKKGWNDLLVKVANQKGHWGLKVRFDDSDNKLKFGLEKK